MSTTDLSATERVKRGTVLTVQDACGRKFRKRALGPVVDGHNFPVVWMCSEDEWAEAQAEGRDADGRPWPVEDIQSIEAASAVAQEVGR